MEKVRYTPDGRPITGEALKVRADVMLPNAAMLYAQEPDGAAIGMVSITWNMTAVDALDKLSMVFASFVSEFKQAQAAAAQAANEDKAN